MRMVSSMNAVTHRAAEALTSVLHGVSQVKIKAMDLETPRADLKVDILAHVDVHGHSHTLMCKVRASGRPDHVRMALQEFQVNAGQFAANATPVLIAPHFSEESQALCRACKAGFLDLEGNARLDLGDVFIGKRSLPHARKRAAVPQIGVRGVERIAGAA